jgi:hypothetical protein
MIAKLFIRLLTTALAFAFFPVVVVFALVTALAALAGALEKIWQK